jgi:serine/threonine protein kinase
VIDSFFMSRTIIFVGISVDDIATGGLLSNLRTQGVETGAHYWITSRDDRATDKWAEERGIQVLRYSVEHGHSEAILWLADDLTSFVSYDEEILEPVQHVDEKRVLLSPEDLERCDPEDIRQALSYHASWLLGQPKSDNDKKIEYRKFCEDYEEAVHKAWMVSRRPPRNLLFGYSVERTAGTGAFGTVYKAKGQDGTDVAVKLLNKAVSEQETMLGSFRRGVRSMEILSSARIAGMVPYKEAFQLPPCVVMEFVDGANLQDAVDSGSFDRWEDGVRVALRVGEIVRQGHRLPQRVLHRDLRPQNIMLKGFWEPEGWRDVVVLDFDLSWHRGATEESVDIRGGAGLGYLAPEQLTRIPGVSTRNTAVDAYGLAMTMFFIFTGKHPEANESGYASWPSRLRTAVARDAPRGWRCLPQRLERIVRQATKQKQTERLDLGDVVSELERMSTALEQPEEMNEAEIWAEEVLATAFPDIGYKWDYDSAEASVLLASGVQIVLRSSELESKVSVEIVFTYSGDRDWRTVARFLPVKKDTAAAMLRRGGWLVEGRTSEQTLVMAAHYQVSDLRRRKAEAAQAVRDAAGELALE